MSNLITSPQNKIIKSIVKLQQKSSERKSSGLFVAEGHREVSIALRHGVIVHKLILCPALFIPDPYYPIDISTKQRDQVIEVSEGIYRKIAYREGVEGIILVGKTNSPKLKGYKPSENPLIIVIEGVEKPGNLGAILRTTDAAGAEAIFVCDARTDLFNPNVIRSSLGCVFSQKIFECSSTQAIDWLHEKRITIFAASPYTSLLYFDVNFNVPAAIAFGAEDKGLSSIWLKNAEQMIRIPMDGVIDSLNVAASVAIVAYEAIRQRTSLRPIP